MKSKTIKASLELEPAADALASQHLVGSASAARVVGAVPHATPLALAAPANSWGWLPSLSMIASLGVLLVAIAFTGSRAAASGAELWFWAGLLVLIIPIALRLISADAARQERIGLVVLLGLGLYAVKLMHSPLAFTFSDELSHVRNVREVLDNQHLFHENPALPVTAFYPGLQTATGALAALSGLTIFQAGLVIIGAARLLLLLSIFLLYEQLSGSARVAGIGALIYMANSNFVFWSAQFAYESLALPLAMLVLFVIARREIGDPSAGRWSWGVAALLGTTAVVVSHHMTSFALVAFLGVVSAGYLITSRGRRAGPLVFALAALGATTLWLILVAHATIDYVSPVLLGAYEAALNLITGAGTSRQLFASASTGYIAPLWEQATGIAAVVLVLLGLPFGLWQAWRLYRRNIFVWVLAGAACAYFPVLGLRLIPAGWETANRASEFLFVGIAFIVALGIVKYWMPYRAGWIGSPAFAGYIAVLVVGGILVGWQPKIRMARPYAIGARGGIIEPQGVTAARWTLAFLGPDNRMAVDASNAKLIAAYGEQYPFTRRRYGVRSFFFSTSTFGRTERTMIQKTGVRYILVDRREISWDHMTGIYFNRVVEDRYEDTELIDRRAYTRLDAQPNVSRLFDSGNIVIYNVGVFANGASQ
jgi:hypothetical protein